MVVEMDFRASAPTRERTFPDLATVLNDDWAFVWEGVISGYWAIGSARRETRPTITITMAMTIATIGRRTKKPATRWQSEQAPVIAPRCGSAWQSEQAPKASGRYRADSPLP